ncbi:MAG: histidine triad nucleotide-binding protein [Halioglobus sp.]|nr:histidine triad nucleotide-binding protein [Halioglobus sp.]
MSDSECLFCRICSRELDAEIVYESETVLAFHDINPQAPTHVLIVPRKHVSTINDLETGDAETVGALFLAAKDIAAEAGLSDDGYRVTMNCNEGAGQSVFHIHLHLLGGRNFSWPPG